MAARSPTTPSYRMISLAVAQSARLPEQNRYDPAHTQQIIAPLKPHIPSPYWMVSLAVAQSAITVAQDRKAQSPPPLLPLRPCISAPLIRPLLPPLTLPTLLPPSLSTLFSSTHHPLPPPLAFLCTHSVSPPLFCLSIIPPPLHIFPSPSFPLTPVT